MVQSWSDDPVNHPKHYEILPGIEAIDIIRALLTEEEFKGYLKGNNLKYQLRADAKGNPEQNRAKGQWYITYLNKLHTTNTADSSYRT